ncbi:MAG: hypothetical protein DBX55_03215 [Verrucomicrobia bacterium]|nr:MAG: hypothetical protein DBX55_03215 [Verrucomicrobiota bacterium]
MLESKGAYQFLFRAAIPISIKSAPPSAPDKNAQTKTACASTQASLAVLRKFPRAHTVSAVFGRSSNSHA